LGGWFYDLWQFFLRCSCCALAAGELTYSLPWALISHKHVNNACVLSYIGLISEITYLVWFGLVELIDFTLHQHGIRRIIMVS